VEDRSTTVARSLRFWVILRPEQPDESAIEVKGPRVLIGRDKDCQVVIDDPTVSRHHAAISVRPGRPLILEDLGSANGTLVNGRPIRPPVGFAAKQEQQVAHLRGGEWLQFGDTLAVVSLVPPAPTEGTGTPNSRGP
jgi:pSer/pThr/pTyr-binding forkhead associated (FHA) protein